MTKSSYNFRRQKHFLISYIPIGTARVSSRIFPGKIFLSKGDTIMYKENTKGDTIVNICSRDKQRNAFVSSNILLTEKRLTKDVVVSSCGSTGPR